MDNYQYHIFSPYRVCPLGAHVDHQHGLVTGFAFEMGVDLWFNPTDDGEVRLKSLTFEGDVEFSVTQPSQVKNADWGDYARGAKYALKKRFELTRGIEGGIKGSLFALDKLSIDDDLLVVAADNILMFSFQEFVDFAREKDSSCIMCHEQPSIERLQRTGVVVLDEDGKVLNMVEKPVEPKSHWAVPPFYIYLRKDLDLVRDSVENGCGKDAPGNLAHYMVDNTLMHAWKMTAGRFDIGSLDSYEEAKKLFG